MELRLGQAISTLTPHSMLTARSRARCASRSELARSDATPLRSFLNDQRHAAVLLPALGIVAAVGLLIGRDRLARAEACGLKFRRSETSAACKPASDRCRATLRELLVVGIAAFAVAMAFDPHRAVALLSDELGRFGERGRGIRANSALSKSNSTSAASSMRSSSAVSRSSSRSRKRRSATGKDIAEDGNTRLALGNWFAASAEAGPENSAVPSNSAALLLVYHVGTSEQCRLEGRCRATVRSRPRC